METSIFPDEGLHILTHVPTFMFDASGHLLWHGTSVYECHLREFVSFQPGTQCLTVMPPLPVLTTYYFRAYILITSQKLTAEIQTTVT